MRLVCWYSHGAASLIAAKKAVESKAEFYPEHDLVIACIHLENEYHEPERYKSVEKFLGHKITWLKDEKYSASVDEVIKKTRYMSGVRGARCTAELKKRVRREWQKDSDVHVFGFDVNEAHRVDQILDSEPELEIYAPLVELGFSKKDCFKLMKEAGLSLPKMYQLGYHNNNCIGCLKAAGAGYWNKIRNDFPKVFDTRAEQERLLNVALVKMSYAKVKRLWPHVFDEMLADGYTHKTDNRGSMRIPLRYLPPDAGSHKDLDIGDCGIFCDKKD